MFVLNHELDPFSVSGTILRVCQQLNRHCVGIKINPECVDTTRIRLEVEFNGFDDVDPRMERVPFDERKQNVREQYRENHKRWFLKNHQNTTREFDESVKDLRVEFCEHYFQGIGIPFAWLWRAQWLHRNSERQP